MNGKFTVEHVVNRSVVVIADRIGIRGRYLARLYVRGKVRYTTSSYGGSGARQKAIDHALDWWIVNRPKKKTTSKS